MFGHKENKSISASHQTLTNGAHYYNDDPFKYVWLKFYGVFLGHTNSNLMQPIEFGAGKMGRKMPI